MNDLIRYFLESGATLALLFMIYRFFLSRDTFFRMNRLFLLTALGVSFLLPSLDLTRPVYRLFPFLFPPLEPAYGPDAVYLPDRSFDVTRLLIVAYLGGASFLLFRFLGRITGLALLVRRAGFQRSDGFNLVVADEIDTPFSFFHFIFLNAGHMDHPNLDRLLAHEMVHVRQFHSADLLLAELATVLQWFNPAAWSCRRALKETHEFLADEEVIAMGFSRAGYQRLIYEQLVGAGLYEFANNFNDSQIKRRLEMMTKARSRGLARLKALTSLPVLFLLAVSFGAAGETPAPTVPGQEKQANLSKNELLKMLQEVDAKLAGGSLSAEEREMLLNKKKKIEMTLKNQPGSKGNAGEMLAPPPPPKIADLMKMRNDIDAKLAEPSLSEKDRETLLKKKQKVETELKKQKEAEKKVSEDGDVPPPPPKKQKTAKPPSP